MPDLARETLNNLPQETDAQAISVFGLWNYFEAYHNDYENLYENGYIKNQKNFSKIDTLVEHTYFENEFYISRLLSEGKSEELISEVLRPLWAALENTINC